MTVTPVPPEPDTAPRSLFGRPTIGAWLFVTPIIAIGFFAALAFLTLQNFRSQERVLSEIRSGTLERLESLSDLSHAATVAHPELLAAFEAMAAGAAPGEPFMRARAALAELFALEIPPGHEAGGASPHVLDQREYGRLVELFEGYREQASAALEATAGGQAVPRPVLDGAETAYRELNALHEALTADAFEHLRHLTGLIQSHGDAFSRDLILVLIASALMSLVVSWLISLALSRDLMGVIRAMTRLARGSDEVVVQGLRRRDEIGDLARATAVFSDTLHRLREEIEQRERTEDALRTERNFATAVTDTIGALIMVLDRKGRIVRFNRACETLTGYPAAEIAGASPWDRLVAEEDRDRSRALISALDAGNRNNSFESSWLTPNGERRQISWANSTLVDEGGEVDHVICCGVDITERKLVEKRMRQAHKMQAVGQLTGGIAHDFNNLLAVILIDLDLVLRRVAGDEQTARMVEHAIAAGNRGAALTNRLLSFARQQPLRPEVVKLDRLVDGMVGLMARTIGESITVATRHGEALWPCTLDPRQLEEALINLALNARDAMPNGGQLLFETGNSRLILSDLPEDSGLAPGDYVQLSVTDTGGGIPEAIRGRIFEPFFTTKDIGLGSGLGLSMVFGFVKQSKGHITVHSLEDWGTTFRMFFPRSDAAAEADIGPAGGALAEAQAEIRGRRILLVEDDPDLRRTTAALLDGLGYSVVEAVDGAQAIERLRGSGRFDLLFSDLRLAGGISGGDVAQQARALDPQLKVLFMSGDPGVVEPAAPSGEEHCAVLQKPFRRRDLESALRDTLEP